MGIHIRLILTMYIGNIGQLINILRYIVNTGIAGLPVLSRRWTAPCSPGAVSG
jgi:hypothetical protein